jgi:hypothetical protein
LPTMSAGALCGTPTPYQMTASYPGTVSAIVGRSDSTSDIPIEIIISFEETRGLYVVRAFRAVGLAI